MPHSNPLQRRGRLLCLAAAVLAALTLTLALNAPSAPAAPSCLGKKATIVSGKKTIVGKKAHDVIVVLGGGRHTVRGQGGNDRICGGSGEDLLYGEKGSDRIDGGGGNDRILGDRGGDKLSGGEGDDYVDGQKGSDEVDGGSGADRLFGDKGNDTMDGGPGDGDYLDGGLGDEKLENGGEGNGDIVIGNLGTDNLSGGPGDGDVIRGDGGIDTIDGGGGNQDIASFGTSPAPGVVVNLGAGTATGDGHDTLRDIDDIAGSPFDDQITGNGGLNRIDGGPGNDELSGGGGGGDQGFGGAGGDTCSAFDEVSSCNDRTPPQQETAVELNRGLDGVSVVVTGLGEGNQITVAYNGSAFVVSDPTGIETREGSGCTASGAPLSPVVPGKPTRTDPKGTPTGGEKIGPDTTATCPSGVGVSFVLIDGGGGNDTISVGGGIPGSLSVRISGGNGNDTISGGPGDDLLESGDEYSGTSGSDILNGEAGNDGLVSDPGGDQLNGGDGNDLLVSSAAVCQGHKFDGGGGLDTVSYARSKPSGTLTMTLGGAGKVSGGCGAPDSILATSESLEGSEGKDKMVGDAQNNTLFGHGGADIFMGKGGSDSIEAVDGEKDKKIDCGPGGDQGAFADSSDPKAKSC
jgi:Ca2+-binding RTX toxin-like protein